jgi:hypothetical protein
MVQGSTNAHAGLRDFPGFRRGGDVLFHLAGPAHRHSWQASRNRTGIKTRSCRDCGTVQFQIRGAWMKAGS